MCQIDPAVEPKIQQTIKQFLDEGRMFTAYDVTTETRSREDIHMRHNDVRGGIHEIQCLVDAIEWGHDDGQGNDAKWKKSQIPMPGGKWAFVYHIETVDPNQYQPHGQTAQPHGQTAQKAVTTQTPVTNMVSCPLSGVTAAAAAAAVQVQSNDSGGQNSDGTFSTDYRNRLLVRTGFMKDLGLERDNTVCVVMDSDNNRILLMKDYPKNFDDPNYSVNSQQVERNGDLRLSSKTLRTAGLDIAENFVIENSEVEKVAVIEIRQA